MNKEFRTYRLTDAGLEKAKQIANAFDVLLNTLNRLIPDGGREMAIARTKLEEACFFAKKSMAEKNVAEETPPDTEG